MNSYRDRWIQCTSDAILIRGYYFPWGTKHIPYSAIRSVKRVEIAAFTGKGRVWGTANPRYWASLDPQRPRKTEALILDLGRPVKPFITPGRPRRRRSRDPRARQPRWRERQRPARAGHLSGDEVRRGRAATRLRRSPRG